MFEKPKLQLREAQERALEMLRQGFAAGHRTQILVGPTGFGKTELAIAMMDAARRKGSKTAMILDRIVLCEQTSQRLEKYGIDHGVLQSGHWRYRPHEHIQVCSAQTLEKRGSFPGLTLMIVDECFTGETLISTPSGCLPIKLVRNGDKVYTASGIGTVLQTMVRPATEIYTLEFDDGSIIRCTGNHPIFTERGWIRANELGVGALSFSEQGVLDLWEYLQAKDKNSGRQGDCGYWREEVGSPENLLSILLEEIPASWGMGDDRSFAPQETLPELRSGIWAKNQNGSRTNLHGGGTGCMGEAKVLHSTVCHEDGESNEQSPDQKEGDCKTTRDQAQTNQERWKRAVATAAAASLASCVGRGLGVGGGSGNGVKKYRARLSNLLQDRHSEQRKEDWDRGGWRISQHAGETSGGRKENRILGVARLVNISIEQRESATPVFNLHVSGHPSYFANGRLVHNCHAKRRQTTDFIKNNPNVKVVGLSATPLTKGLGDVYSNVVNAVTTRELVDKKLLAPLRVFIAKEIDMEGAKKVAGEWSEAEATKRGMQITGDIVAEWVKKTYEIFGKPVKTIVFSAGVEHGADLARKFAEQGYNFISISYRDDDDYKKQVIEEFGKPDTDIHGLIATDILTKGFSVDDVMIGISARPFSKSLSSHIQQMGRVMRTHPNKEFAVWLCHSGNYLRFKEDWDEIYEEGISKLDDSREKPKKEKTKKEKEASKCPACGALWPSGTDTCIQCGHIRQRANKVGSVPGELEELAMSGGHSRESKQDWWAMCQYKIRYSGWNPGRAAHTYKDKFGVWPRGLDDTQVKTPSLEFEKAVKAALIRYLKRKKAA